MSRRQPASLRSRVRFLFAYAGLAAVVMTTVGTVAVLGVLDARQEVIDELDPARAAADALLVSLLDQQNSLRGVLLTGAPEFTSAFEDAVVAGDRAVERLRGLLDGRSALLAGVDGVAAAVAAWQREFAATELEVLASGGTVAPSVVEASRAAYEQIRADLRLLHADISVERAAARTDLDDATTRLVAALVGALVALLVIATVMLTALKRWVLDPVDHLGVEAEQVRRGSLERVIEPSGPPELQSLGRSVEAMRARLQSELLEVEEARSALAELTEDLTRSNRDLEQFAYVASHDLQEPLRKIISFCQLLQQRYGGQLDERADQYIEFAVDGARRMQGLINDLLAFSRVGRMTGELVPVRIEDCLRRALDNLSEVVAETGAVVEHDPLPEVVGDASLLTLVFQNLLSNALKFRRPATAPHVRITAARQPEGWEIAVADNGIGIGPEHADRVFVIFQRLHTKDAYAGTGIGLALCRRIIEHHDGEIWIEGSEAPGTTVRFSLPDHDRPAGQVDERHAIPTQHHLTPEEASS